MTPILIILGIFFGVMFAEGVAYLYRHNEWPFNLFYHNSARCFAPFCEFTVLSKDREELKRIMDRHIWEHNNEGEAHAS